MQVAIFGTFYLVLEYDDSYGDSSLGIYDSMGSFFLPLCWNDTMTAEWEGAE